MTRASVLRKLALGDMTAADEYAYTIHVAVVELYAVLGSGPLEFVESLCKRMFSVNDLLAGLSILIGAGNPVHVHPVVALAPLMLALDCAVVGPPPLIANCIRSCSVSPMNLSARMSGGTWKVVV